MRLYYNKGTLQKVDCGNGTDMMFAANSSLGEFCDYCTEVQSKGYTKVFERTVAENIFAAFRGAEEYIYAYYTKNTGCARIVHGPLATWADEDCGTLPEICEPLLYMVGQPEHMNCGMGYIYRLADGRFLVLDGGCRYESRPDFMYEAIRNLAVDKDRIVIAAWFVTHPHDDHQEAFEEFIERHGADSTVRVERVVFNYAPAPMYVYRYEDGRIEDDTEIAGRIYEKCATHIPSAQVVRAHTGQLLRFGECKVEVLYTVEDILPVDHFDYINVSSLVIRVTLRGQSVLFLADTTHTSGALLEKMYGDFLASDMVQLAHHGMWASHPSLYERIRAKTVLWPNVETVAQKWVDDKPIATALSMADDVYLSGTDGEVLALPHVTKSNKAAVLAKLNK